MGIPSIYKPGQPCHYMIVITTNMWLLLLLLYGWAGRFNQIRYVRGKTPKKGSSEVHHGVI